MNDVVRADDRHEKYVRLGWCPSVHWSKTWCNMHAGHEGRHMALRLMPDGRYVLGTEWD